MENMVDYEIREATIHDKEKIIDFIDIHWKKDHIVVRDSKFFDFLYVNFEKNKLNFILGIEGNEIKALLGYIEYSENGDKFLSFWKNSGNMLLGMNCLNFLNDKIKQNRLSCCGINKKTIPCYQYFGYETGRLKHFYILNEEFKIDEFKICKINNKKIRKIEYLDSERKELIKLENIEELKNDIKFIELENNIYFKPIEYIEKRYFRHPYYKYEIYGIKKSGKSVSLLIMRKIEINNSKCLRIIDYIGNTQEINGTGQELENIMKKNKCEYIDFYQIGMNEDILLKNGFVERKENDENIIPNYFEPFEEKNVEINYFTNCKDKFKMFKGDGDQDRPS